MKFEREQSTMVKGKMNLNFCDPLEDRKKIDFLRDQQNWQPFSNFLTKEKIKN